MLESAHTRKTLTTLLAALTLLATGATAYAQDTEENLNRWTEKLDYDGPLPDRPVLIGDRLVWDDRGLLDLCTELDGTFRKLAGRSEFMCRLPAHLSDTTTARNDRRE